VAQVVQLLLMPWGPEFKLHLFLLPFFLILIWKPSILHQSNFLLLWQIPEENELREERLILAQDFRGFIHYFRSEVKKSIRLAGARWSKASGSWRAGERDRGLGQRSSLDTIPELDKWKFWFACYNVESD
jgi:hypothetical protein